MKNLENVQGDERDVILFSTAFSVNSRGSLPLNFGPLNRAGGERRLNVAITRARRQVVVFSSFDPAQLRAEETSSVGIKHLRAYLDLAEQGPSALGPLPAGTQLRIDRPPSRGDRRGVAAEGFRGAAPRSDCPISPSTWWSRPVDRAEDPVLAVLLDGPGWAASPHRRRSGRPADRGAVEVDALAGRRTGLDAGVARRPGRCAGPARGGGRHRHRSCCPRAGIDGIDRRCRTTRR